MEKKLKYDFSGWATRNDLVCSDGRTFAVMRLRIATERPSPSYGITSMTTRPIFWAMRCWRTARMAFTLTAHSTKLLPVRLLS